MKRKIKKKCVNPILRKGNKSLKINVKGGCVVSREMVTDFVALSLRQAGISLSKKKDTISRIKLPDDLIQ